MTVCSGANGPTVDTEWDTRREENTAPGQNSRPFRMPTRRKPASLSLEPSTVGRGAQQPRALVIREGQHAVPASPAAWQPGQLFAAQVPTLYCSCRWNTEAAEAAA